MKKKNSVEMLAIDGGKKIMVVRGAIIVPQAIGLCMDMQLSARIVTDILIFRFG